MNQNDIGKCETLRKGSNPVIHSFCSIKLFFHQWTNLMWESTSFSESRQRYSRKRAKKKRRAAGLEIIFNT